MAFATEEEQKGPEQVMELDPQNQAVETAQVEEPAAAPAEVEHALEAQSVVQPDPKPPELSLPSLEDRSTYVVGDEIQVPTEVVGTPSGSVKLTIVAARNGVETVTALIPLVLSEGGQAHHSWTFKPEMEGEYDIQIIVEDDLGNRSRRAVTLFAEPRPEEQKEQHAELEEELAQKEDPNKKEMTFAT